MDKSYLHLKPPVPLGLRNNNPGNLIISNTAWKGKKPRNQNTNGHFEQFTALKWGIRALFRQLYTDIEKRNMNLTQLLNKYAPSFENNTNAYIKTVAKETGLSPTYSIPLTKETIISIAKAIVKVEIGKDWTHYITNSDYEEAYELTGLTLKKKLELE